MVNLNIHVTKNGYGVGRALRIVRELTRPVTLVPVFVISVMFGLVGAHTAGQSPDWYRIVLAACLLVVANAASNMINEIGDQVEDSVNPSKADRPVVSGVVHPMNVLSVAIVSWLVAMIIGALAISSMFASVYGTILLFAFLYTYPPRLKKRFPFNYAAIATPRGGLGIAAAFIVQGTPFSPVLWSILAVTVPFVLFANETRNIDDVEGDTYAGVQTISVVWGEKAGRIVSFIGFALPPVIIAALGLYPSHWLLFLSLIPPALAAVGIRRWSGKRLWMLFYGSFAFLAILLGISFL